MSWLQYTKQTWHTKGLSQRYNVRSVTKDEQNSCGLFQPSRNVSKQRIPKNNLWRNIERVWYRIFLEKLDNESLIIYWSILLDEIESN